MNKQFETIRETEGFQVTSDRRGGYTIRTASGKPKTVKISRADASYLTSLKDDSFDMACVWDFGCGVFA